MVDTAPNATNARGELTPAQERTLHALARGLKYSAAADYLGVSPRTVEQHVQAIARVSKHRNLFQLGMWYLRRYPNGAPQ